MEVLPFVPAMQFIIGVSVMKTLPDMTLKYLPDKKLHLFDVFS